MHIHLTHPVHSTGPEKGLCFPFSVGLDKLVSPPPSLALIGRSCFP
jgi:hypothetical protein